MEQLKESLMEIITKQRGLFVLMVMLFLASAGLFITSLVMTGSSSTMIAGYGDLESYGYKFGGWLDAWTFPVLAVVFGVVHNFLVIRVFREKGESWAKVLAATSILLVVGALIVLGKLFGEG